MSRPNILEGTATTDGIQRRPFRISDKIVFLTNDSATFDLRYNFDATTDEAGAGTLKPGETVSDISPITVTSISLKGIGGAVPFRVMGV
jgi:hypothetical protein